MLKLEKLKELATKNQTLELNVKREYLQHLFLSHFYEQKGSNVILFKGGTALKLIYGSPRFSEDLDFSTTKGNTLKIEDILQNSLAEIEKEGIDCEIVESKTTSGGYLAIINFELNREKVSLQMEISYRDRGIKKEITTLINPYIPPYTIYGLNKEILVEQKIQALLTRQKPRDFYDLYFMLRANLVSPKQKESLRKALEELSKTKINFEKELKQFLPKSHWPIIKNFKNSLRSEIQRHI